MLVLPTRTVGYIPNLERWQQRFRDEVEGAFRAHSEISLAPLSPLTAKDLACAEVECMHALAAAKAVDGVVWSTATIEGSRYRLAVGMYISGAMRPPMDGASESGEVGAAKELRRLATFVAADAMPVIAHGALTHEPVPVPPAVVTPPPVMPSESPPPAPRGHDNALIAGAVITGALAVGGVLLAGFGVAVLHDDGRSTCHGGPASSCPTVYDTKAPGAAMLATGVAVAVGSAIGLGFELRALRRRSSMRASVLPAIGSGAAGVVVGGQW